METNILAEALINSNNLFVKRTGYQMKKQSEKGSFDFSKDGKVMDKIDNSLINLFISSIDKESQKRLMDIKNKENQIIDYIQKTTGWTINNGGATLLANFRNQRDPEFASHDTYHMARDENGFNVKTDVPFNSYYGNIRQVEQAFYEKHIDQLEQLHSLMLDKEQIMLGNYTIINSNINEQTMTMIAEYLGYKNKEQELTRNHK